MSLSKLERDNAIADYYKKLSQAFSKFNEYGHPYLPSDHVLEYPNILTNEDTYLYVIRIYCRQGFVHDGVVKYYCYKVGCSKQMINRICNFDTVYQARASIIRENLLFCFLGKVEKSGKVEKLEKKLKKILNDHLIDDFVIKNLNKESFDISIESYILIEEFFEEHFNSEQSWITEKYAINDESEEFFNEQYMGETTRHEEYDYRDYYNKSDVFITNAESEDEDSN